MGIRFFLRALGAVVGCIMVVLGGWMSWGMPDQTDGAPSVIGLFLRPPSGAGGWRALGEGEAKVAGDIEVSIAFDVQKTKRRKSPTTTQLRATILVGPNTDQMAASQEHAALAAHRELIADEVERRTERPVYAEAVRREGEFVSVNGARTWWGLGLFAVGMVMAVSSIRGKI